MSLVLDILKELWNEHSPYYRNQNSNIFGFPLPEKHSSSSIRATVHRLQKRGYIVRDSEKRFTLSPAGKLYIERKLQSLEQFENPFQRSAAKDLLVMFDIPEVKKAEREWFREHLKRFGYKMIQKSVWIGPSPLPKEFLDYLKKLNLHKNMKTMRLAKGSKIESRL